MKDRIRISIVTPTYNSANTLKETILSVLDQKFDSFEHIVMDGGSADGTLDILRQFPHLKVISEKDEGHYHAMNKGIQMAKGDVVAILNGDDCYRPNCLNIVDAAFQNNPSWDGLFCDIAYVDGQSQEIFKREEALFDYDVLRWGLCYVVHPTLFLKRKVYEELGGYRYKEYKNCCDFELILRLGKEKYSIGHVPEVLVNYRFHQYGQSADLRIQKNMENEALSLQKQHGRPDNFLGTLLHQYARVKRQMQKLAVRGKCDLIPGKWLLKKHTRDKTTFSSNIGLDKLS
jgi:glycosyltransferase involved in cell wall biosynthesis